MEGLDVFRFFFKQERCKDEKLQYMSADQHNFMGTDGLELKMPNGWRTKSLVHKFRLHSRRGKGMAESFSREKLRHAPQKEGG